jgi:hypothetical protein
MIWNDAVDLGPLGMFPPAVHFRPRGAQSILGILEVHNIFGAIASITTTV